jgi:hypothetical protein
MLKAVYSRDELVVFDMERKKQEFRPALWERSSSSEPTTDSQRALLEKLEAFVDDPATQAARPDLDEDTRKKLRDLGYFDGVGGEEEGD